MVGSLAVHSRADGDVGGPEGAVALVRFRISNFPISHVHLRYWREEVGEGLFVEFEAGGFFGEEGFDEGGLFALEFEDAVFDGAAADEFVDEDGRGLADAVGAVGGLVFGSLLSGCQHRPDFFSIQSDRSLWLHTRTRRSRRLHNTPAASLPLPRIRLAPSWRFAPNRSRAFVNASFTNALLPITAPSVNYLTRQSNIRAIFRSGNAVSLSSDSSSSAVFFVTTPRDSNSAMPLFFPSAVPINRR